MSDVTFLWSLLFASFSIDGADLRNTIESLENQLNELKMEIAQQLATVNENFPIKCTL